MYPVIAAFLGISVLCYGLGWILMRGRRNRDAEVFSGGRRRPLSFGTLTVALAGVLPSTTAGKTAVTKDLRRAGYYHRFAFEEFAALRNALIVGWVLLIGTLIVVGTEPGDQTSAMLLIVGLVGTLLLYGLPRLILRSRAGARVQRIEYSLPDALDMITMCMTGGLPLHGALGRVSKELGTTHPDLACELRILGRQMEAGSLDKALMQFADRIDTPDAQGLAVLVSQTERQGGSVSAAFHEFADEVRRARRQRAEERGNKTTVKMLLPLVFCLAPPIYMLLLTPAIIELRSFVLEENRVGGVLSPDALAAEDGTVDVEDAADRFSYLSFVGGGSDEAQPE
jgi:tight adherence protein C